MLILYHLFRLWLPSHLQLLVRGTITFVGLLRKIQHWPPCVVHDLPAWLPCGWKVVLSNRNSWGLQFATIGLPYMLRPGRCALRINDANVLNINMALWWRRGAMRVCRRASQHHRQFLRFDYMFEDEGMDMVISCSSLSWLPLPWCPCIFSARFQAVMYNHFLIFICRRCCSQ